MPNPSSVCGDSDAFMNETADIQNAVDQVRKQLPAGNCTETCISCGTHIPGERRRIFPGVKYCVQCAYEIENDPNYNEE